jgi:Fe-S cluster assembly protein SufD
MSAAAHAARSVVSPAMRSFEQQFLEVQGRPIDSLSEFREPAMQRFMALGLPSNHDDSWRYTNLRSLSGIRFSAAQEHARSELEPFASVSLLDGAQRVATISVVNGYPWLHSVDSVINEIEVSSLREIARVEPAKLTRFFEAPSNADNRRWALLNTALFADGLYLKITKKVQTPLVILHVGIGGDTDTISYPRIIIEAAPGSSATIIEHHVAQGARAVVVNSNTHIALGRGAQLEHYRVFATGPDATHFDFLDLSQEHDSRCKQFTIALGGGMVRADMDVHLNQPGATLESQALLVGYENRHVDCVNTVTHAARDTTSRQTARAIASDTSRVIFNSKVIVNAGAVHSESQQSCRGLLLSQAAEIDSRPQLEIHTDEVKCAHGATTGRLDPDMLFYLLSRGLDRNTAQSLLVFAFLADVLSGMSVASARASIENALINQMPDSQLLRNFR